MSSAQPIPPPPPRPGTVVIEHPKVPGSWKIVRAEDFDPSRMQLFKEAGHATVQEKRQRQEVRPPIPPPARAQEPPPPPPPAPGIPRRGRTRAKAVRG